MAKSYIILSVLFPDRKEGRNVTRAFTKKKCHSDIFWVRVHMDAPGIKGHVEYFRNNLLVLRILSRK